ncbi:hypothetical protein BDD43_2329 [Mucilaginibacter gracilis]|uniref:Double-GTPase 2 domain-containing protein n=1 Tax=Mucilaginibacter gracilis TaxID=423350 RepID=A0A495IZL9_9SPHI|nr:hypothetical protein [Mucilaginibacter gracilis]RKR82160.1 hypothetical protein BDD43_2329 [Mucilaginibacter gracilis]
MDQELDNICRKPECTYSQTGQCVLNNDALTCPDRLASIADLVASTVRVRGEIVLSAPVEMERLSSSLSLTVNDTKKITRGRYCKIIGILGVPGTGKTASLVSLYLLLAHDKLKGFRFLDSKSVMAFEEISKGARRWNIGKLPEHLTAHTELQDERIAGYLHLRLQQIEDNGIMDLLLTDLPGEWTTTLIETNRTDRLGFLKAADRIWITVNAEEIEKINTRQYIIHRLSLLINRISTFLEGKVPDITIVVTHCDKVANVAEYLTPLQALASGFDIKIAPIASFSGNDNVPPGSGIDELIADLPKMRNSSISEFWPNADISEETRHILQFQNNR